jgi:1-acyl-sn-glycerol-3-phosphate acyltransferase
MTPGSRRARAAVHALLSFGPLEPWVRRIALQVTQGMWPVILGSRRSPRRGPLVVGAGHMSANDLSLMSAAVPRRLAVVYAQGVEQVPGAGLTLTMRGGFALETVPFGGSERNAAMLEEAARAVRDGEALLVFPQGTVEDVGSGAVRIAARAGAPLLPVMNYVVRTPRARPPSTRMRSAPVP